MYRKYRISQYFLRKIVFYFPSTGKYHIFGEKNTVFPDNTGKIMFLCNFFGNTIFLEHLGKNKGFSCSENQTESK